MLIIVVMRSNQQPFITQFIFGNRVKTPLYKPLKLFSNHALLAINPFVQESF